MITIRRMGTGILVLAATVSIMAMAAEPAATPVKTGRIRFEKRQLARNLAEGCTIADVDKDGKLDVIAGPNWYAAPDWRPRPIREMKPTGPQNEYFGTNGDHAIDLNGDGWVDVLSASWFSDEIHWFENPGKAGLEKGDLWKDHVATRGYPQCEGTILADLDGDSKPELVISRWVEGAPVPIVKIVPGEKGSSPTFKTFEIGKPGHHGAGVGDVNGDDRPDILNGEGWFENPGGDVFSNGWTFHPVAAWRDSRGNPTHASLPFLCLDLTGDGKNDVIMSQAHDYGLWWLEQGPAKDGEITWKKHEIDKSFSQVHMLLWADIEGKGKKDLITGKRYRAHNDGDPGAKEPMCLYRFIWNAESKTFEKDAISYDEGVSTGMQICVQDLDGDGKPDIAAAGKTGTHVLFNRGVAKQAQ